MNARHLNFFGLFLLCCLTKESADALRTYYMSDLCAGFRTSYTINIALSFGGSYASSGILKATSFGRYDNKKTCVVTLDPGMNNIVIAIRKIDLRLGCVDSLTLNNGVYEKKTVYCSDHFYDPNEWRVFESLSNVTINFTTGKSFFSPSGGFELVFTSYHNTPCMYNEYKCDNFRCIAKDLTCDGHNHCGDRSDQRYCSTSTGFLRVKLWKKGKWKNSMSTGGIVGTVFGVIFLGIAVVAGIVYCRRRQRRIITTSYQTPQQQIYTTPCPTQPATGIYPPPYQETRPPAYQGNYQPSYQNNISPAPVYMGSPVKAETGKH